MTSPSDDTPAPSKAQQRQGMYSIIRALKDRVTHDQLLTTRLARHLRRSGVASTSGRGRRLAARVVRVEFWTWHPEKHAVRRRTRYTIRAWGWDVRQLHQIVVAALEAERQAKVREVRKRLRQDAKDAAKTTTT